MAKRLYSRCHQCGELKPRSQMLVRRKTGRLRGNCRDCARDSLKEKRQKLGRIYREKKGNICNMCGFTGLACQMDVNHIDGNHRNNEISNLETLCANCHRLVTFVYQRGVK